MAYIHTVQEEKSLTPAQIFIFEIISKKHFNYVLLRCVNRQCYKTKLVSNKDVVAVITQARKIVTGRLLPILIQLRLWVSSWPIIIAVSMSFTVKILLKVEQINSLRSSIPNKMSFIFSLVQYCTPDKNSWSIWPFTSKSNYTFLMSFRRLIDLSVKVISSWDEMQGCRYIESLKSLIW